MSTHVFTLVLDRAPTDHQLDQLADGGCDDAAFGMDAGVPVAEFDREARSLAEAIASAVRGVESVGLVALRVIDSDLLTLADIADRVGQSRESIRRYATGERGPGGFPPPANPARAGTIFYRWSEVVPWLRAHLGTELADPDPTLTVANLVLQARRHRDKVANLAALTGLLS